MPAPSAALSRIRGSSPLCVVPAALGLSAPGTFGLQPTAPRALVACQARRPLAPAVSHTPRHLAHVVSGAIACNASWFRTVPSPLRVVPATFGLNAPGTFGFQPAAPQSPTVCHTPRHLAHAVSRTMRAMQAGSARFPDRCVLCLQPSASVPRAPSVSGPLRHGFLRFTGCLAPGTCGPRAAHPVNARYLYGTTFSSSQEHRNAKATRTRVPPA